MNSAGAWFPDAGRNLRLILKSPVCLAWTLVLTGMQFWLTAMGASEELWKWYETLGLSRGGILAGRFWQILTYGFVHGSWAHLGVNVILLLGMGSRIEFVLGRRAVFLIIVVGILGGAVAHLLIGTGLLVGSSGACLALLLLVVTLSPQSRILPLPVSGKNIARGMICAALGLALVNPDLGLPGLSQVGRVASDHGFAWCFTVGHACHLGGALVGWLAGLWVLRPRVTLESLRRDRARREAE
jgi:membrane associated rhomboid family serine protease